MNYTFFFLEEKENIKNIFKQKKNTIMIKIKISFKVNIKVFFGEKKLKQITLNHNLKYLTVLACCK